MHFQDWFWGVPDNPILGVSKLHARLVADIVQVEELLSFFQQRIAAEEYYANRLADLARKPLRPDGFGQDDSLIANIFCTYQQEMHSLSNSHQDVASKISKVLLPLKQFNEDARKICFPKMDSIDALAKQYHAALAQVQTLRQLYKQKSIEAAEKTTRFNESPICGDMPVMEIMINVGLRSLTVSEFNDFIAEIQRDVKCTDVGSILGAYKSCYLGTDMLHYVKTKCRLDENDALAFFNDLHSSGFIRAINGRFATFVPSLNYQWKRSVYEVTNEVPHRKAIREAEKSEREYKKSIMQVETLRQSLDILSAEFMDIIQKILSERIRTIKDVLSTCAETEKIPVHIIRGIQERLFLFLETLDADKETQVLAERDRTGVRPSIPHLFERYLQGPNDVIFGLDLDVLHSKSGYRVPAILRKSFKFLDDISETTIEAQSPENSSALSPKKQPHKHLEFWLLPIQNLGSVIALRNELNSGKVRAKTLRKYPPSAIIGAIRIYLMELPSSVCSHDLYEPLKLLYLSKSEDVGIMRLNSLRSLLATMSSAHFHTLSFLIIRIRSLISDLDPLDSRITDLAIALGPYFLRPEVENSVSVHDKHRGRLLRDLLVHYDDIISVDILSTANSAEDLPDGVGMTAKSPNELDSDGDDEEEQQLISPTLSSADSEKNRKLSMFSASGSSFKASLIAKRSETRLSIDIQPKQTNSTPNLMDASRNLNRASAGQDGNGVVGDMFSAAKRVGSSWFTQASDVSQIFIAPSSQPISAVSSVSQLQSTTSTQLPGNADLKPLNNDSNTTTDADVFQTVFSDALGTDLCTAPKAVSNHSGHSTVKFSDIILSDESDIEVYGKTSNVPTAPFS
ncbi:hypothetical protein BDV3_002917 [Batrachochytrium dendrobatidis]